ncbi:TMEM165/GDT1 family protein [Magnetospira thiophila]
MAEFLAPAGTAFALIALAEIGDKSQLVCMALAARHRRMAPILAGALLAFALLNGLAVIFGAALAAWIPRFWLLLAVALLFALFGLKELWSAIRPEPNDDATAPVTDRGLFVSAFLVIFLAELGDKTQLATAALAGWHPPLAVWVGATGALVLVSALGVLVGRTLLTRLPLPVLHGGGGLMFLGLAGLAAWEAWSL